MKNKTTILNNIVSLVQDLRKQTNSSCVTLNFVDKNSHVKSISATIEDHFIINLATDHLYHLLNNVNNKGDKLENDYVQICDKALLFNLKEKIDSILNTIVISPIICNK